MTRRTRSGAQTKHVAATGRKVLGQGKRRVKKSAGASETALESISDKLGGAVKKTFAKVPAPSTVDFLSASGDPHHKFVPPRCFSFHFGL
jgi:hypothetical protein